MGQTSRRQFIRLAGVSALALAGAAASGPPEALAAGLFGKLKIYRRTELMMGTYVTITVVDESGYRAADAVSAAFAEISRLEAVLSRYQASGPLAHLAASGRLSSPRPELVSVVDAAGRFHRLTGGAFDATIAPVVDGLQASFSRTGRAPSRERMAELLNRVDGSAVAVSPSEIRLLKEGMSLTLDGLAKGYIVDAAGQTLRGQGVTQGLINAGGDILAIGKKGRSPWRVALTDPTARGGRGPVIGLADKAIATSGNYEVHYDTEKLHHHIVDPVSGASPYGPVSASVKATDCLTADALSTTLFCLPERDSDKLLGLASAEGLIINRGGHRHSRGEWG